jgi:hypothetical protein
MNSRFTSQSFTFPLPLCKPTVPLTDKENGEKSVLNFLSFSLFLQKLMGEIDNCCRLKTGRKQNTWKFRA